MWLSCSGPPWKRGGLFFRRPEVAFSPGGFMRAFCIALSLAVATTALAKDPKKKPGVCEAKEPCGCATPSPCGRECPEGGCTINLTGTGPVTINCGKKGNCTVNQTSPAPTKVDCSAGDCTVNQNGTCKVEL